MSSSSETKIKESLVTPSNDSTKHQIKEDQTWTEWFFKPGDVEMPIETKATFSAWL